MQGKLRELTEVLLDIEDKHSPCAFAHSLGAEDVVLFDAIRRVAPTIEIFTLDTGRLHAETYALLDQLQQGFDYPIKVYTPQHSMLENYLSHFGCNAFYQSSELRKKCCNVRKVEPLQRALAGKKAWITGLRREQSKQRDGVLLQEWDAANQLQKFNPLVDWTEQDVWKYIREYEVPYNKLHDRSYPSIGCEPCTRAVSKGEDSRAGRWWWESDLSKECGLHIKAAPTDTAETNDGRWIVND